MLTLATAALAVVICAGAVGIAALLVAFVRGGQLLAIGTALFFAVMVLAAIGTLVSLQGLLCTFRVVLDERATTYTIRNGLLRWRMVLSTAPVIAVYPAYSSGAWGYGAKLRRAGGWIPWPFCPAGIIGSQAEAADDAALLAQWLRDHCGNVTVVLSGWKGTSGS